MAELLDPDGVWVEELIALMVNVAVELQTNDIAATNAAVTAAAGSLFSAKPAKAFNEKIDRVRREILELKLRARGHGATPAGAVAQNDPAEQMLAVFKRLGLSAGKKPRGARNGKKRRR